MCAISGIVSKDSRLFKRELELMVETLHHRGPDENGTLFFKQAAIGSNRLSIVDLKSGKQPMKTKSGKLGLVFNGEIYGYKDVKKTLTSYHFITTSDTEVVLALYEKFGTELLRHLPGMFAFGLWDEAKQRLFLGRDRFGEKPLYYAFGKNGEFIFASEIKAILATNLLTPVIDKISLSHYLQYLYVPPTRTIYSNIYCLPPGHGLIFKRGKIKTWPYWHLPEESSKLSLEDAASQFEFLFKQAVHRQLIADVPVGALLSGGVDSSSVVAVANGYKKKISTFSFGFAGGRNELSFARIVAKKFNTNHHEFYEKDVDLADLIPRMAEIYDEPFADSSNIPTFLISKLASKYVKVALTGDGGDELLGGYSGWYRPLFFQSDTKIDWKNWLLLEAKRQRSKQQQYHLGGLRFKVARKTLGWTHNRQLSRFSILELKLLGLPIPHSDLSQLDNLGDVMKFDVKNYMPGDILVKTDRASMATGLELRAPFLDTDLASFCLALPYNLKINAHQDKLVLRESLGGLLPKEVLERDKQGFGSPVKSWLQRPEVLSLKKKYLSTRNAKIYSLLPFAPVQLLTRNPSIKTWALLTLAVWAERYL